MGRFERNLAAVFAEYTLISALQALFWIVLPRTLGPQQFGKLVLLINLAGFLADPIHQAVAFACSPELLSLGDRERASLCVSAVIVSLTLSFAAASATLLAVAFLPVPRELRILSDPWVASGLLALCMSPATRVLEPFLLAAGRGALVMVIVLGHAAKVAIPPLLGTSWVGAAICAGLCPFLAGLATLPLVGRPGGWYFEIEYLTRGTVIVVDRLVELGSYAYAVLMTYLLYGPETSAFVGLGLAAYKFAALTLEAFVPPTTLEVGAGEERRASRGLRRYLIPAGVATAVAIVVCADLVPVVLSTEYGPAVPIVRWFSLPTLVLPYHIALRAYLIGSRKLRLLLAYRTLYVVSFLTVFHALIGVFGPVSVSLGLLAALSSAPPMVAMIRRQTVTE
ncbi:lipopolysaccharide biosynthesis protein [Methanopyrus sp.]